MFQLETWLREMVYLELKAHFGCEWWTKADQALKRGKTRGIPGEKSLKADKKYPHMSTPENDPLWYLAFDSLLKIIFDRKLWVRFEVYLTNKKLLRAKFDEIKPIRHRIAHFRSLHTRDLARLEALMSALDQGFWRFCTSYNRKFYFSSNFRKDPIHRHLTMQNIDAQLFYSVRKSAKIRRGSMILPRKGRVYDVIFPTHHRQRFLDYADILAATKSLHRNVVHIMLDGFQQILRVTFPAVEDPDILNQVIETFCDACGNYYSLSPIYTSDKRLRSRRTGPRAEVDKRNALFEEIASEWPHYVLPPSHPFTFLGPDMPCSFFDT